MAYKAFDLTGKVSLVTGGNGGIGLGMALALAQAGSDVVIWGSNPDKNAAAETQLKAIGGRVLAQRVDVSDELAVDAAMAEAVEKMGRVDTVIANAGIGLKGKPFIDIPTEDYRKILAVNLDGVFFTFRAACRHMVERANAGDPGGSLVAISSLSAIVGAARNEHYAATKGALEALTKVVAAEVGAKQIRVNCVVPGAVPTDLNIRAGLFTEEEHSRRMDAIAPYHVLGRVGQPEEIAEAVDYCIRAEWFTGQSIVIDGGLSLGLSPF